MNQNLILNDLYIKDRDLSRAYNDSLTLEQDKIEDIVSSQSLFEDEVDEDYFISDGEIKKENVSSITIYYFFEDL